MKCKMKKQPFRFWCIILRKFQIWSQENNIRKQPHMEATMNYFSLHLWLSIFTFRKSAFLFQEWDTALAKCHLLWNELRVWNLDHMNHNKQLQYFKSFWQVKKITWSETFWLKKNDKREINWVRGSNLEELKDSVVQNW